MRYWRVLILTIALLLLVGTPVHAEVPPPPSHTLAELQWLFPNLLQLPPGMVVQETGERTADAIAETFPDPIDAADALSPSVSDWRYNTYRVYVAQSGMGPNTPARIEVSLHQFSSAGGAASMLPYFSSGRADMLGQILVSPWSLDPCWAAVTGRGETTLYVRLDDLLMRITVVASNEVTGYEAWAMTNTVMFNVATAMLGNAGSSRQLLDQTCQ